MPLTPEQAKNMKDDLYAVIDNYEPPLTTDERNGMSGSMTQLVDNYTSGGGTPVDPGWTTVEYPTTGYTRVDATLNVNVSFTVPDGAKEGPGRVQFAGRPPYDSNNNRTVVLSATPGGPPLNSYAQGGPTINPTVNFYVGPPSGGYPQVEKGSTYYATFVGTEGDKGAVDLYAAN